MDYGIGEKEEKNGPLKDKNICAKAISKNYIQFRSIPAIIFTIYWCSYP